MRLTAVARLAGIDAQQRSRWCPQATAAAEEEPKEGAE